ncbi:MAG TPA: FAD-binding oxidoreductase [Methylomirabilota bacterium]|jgi:sarcosine oxidase subunit beta|nr:FAD-binding oxidoreductase [Methylomirabilota bacterium]
MIAIVGGGLMGLSAAFHLRRLDPSVAVTVLERSRPGAAASGASAAGVRVMGRDPAERALALDSLGRWPELDRELEGDTRYRRDGGLRVALDAAAWSAVPGWVAAQRADGVPLEIVDETVMRRLAPRLSRDCLGGVYSALDGQAEAMPTVLAFATAARRLGARIDDGVGARCLIVERGRVVAVERTDGTRAACDVAIVAAGAWSATLLAPHGVELPLRTRALQMLLTVPAPMTLRQVLGAFDRKLSLKQLGDGAYLIGGGWPALITDEAENRYQILDDSVRASREIAGTVYPAAKNAALARSWAGLEAFTPDEVPLIGPVPGIDGLLVAAGFCGHGFAFSPGVGDILARLALGRDAHEHLWRGLRVDRVTRETVASSAPVAPRA